LVGPVAAKVYVVKVQKQKKPKKVRAVEPDYLLELADIALRDHSVPSETRATARELRAQNKALRQSNRELLDFARNRVKATRKKS
jgi:hypothetical protein